MRNTSFVRIVTWFVVMALIIGAVATAIAIFSR
jgi:hypothetical protein